jgi:hypothetical protein
MATKHLELAYAQWMGASDEQRAKQWQLELARAFVSEREKRREAEERVERVQQEARQLQAQVEMLSRCQWPREMALWPPERVPVGSKVAKELRMELKKQGLDGDGSGGGGEAGTWDFERLVGKWKRVVKEDKSRRMAVLAGQQRPHDVHETPPQTAVLDVHAGEMQGTSKGGASKESATSGEEPRRRSARTHLVTSMAVPNDTVSEFNDTLMMNGNGKG